MIKKQFTPKKTVCKVTFSVDADKASDSVALLGDFNNWDPKIDLLKKKNGAWETTIRLNANEEFKFRYLIDGSSWENDETADAYVGNEFGTEDSVVNTAV
jgi:1,4-alpha-glucan branching enzyme